MKYIRTFKCGDLILKNLLIFTACWLLTSLQIGCTKSNNSTGLKSYVESPYGIRTNVNMSVCFEEKGFDLDRKVVESKVSSEFQEAGYKFSGWLDCSEKSDVIVHFDPNARLSKTTKIVDSSSNKVYRVSIGLKSLCKTGVDFSGSNCEASTAIHEFGHVIGLRHEMNRRDNNECDLDQMDGQGETSAIQIGDFDSDSIMNYCALEGAALQDRYLGLSTSDLENIKALYNFPMALLADNLPRSLLVDSFSLSIVGEGVTQYKFQIGESENINCKDESLYSDPWPSDKLLSFTMLSNGKVKSEVPLGKTIKLCILAGDRQNKWQPTNVYSSVDFSFIDPDDRTPPILKNVELEFDPTNEDFVNVAISTCDASELASISVSFSYLDILFNPKQRTYRFKKAEGNIKKVYARIPVSDFAANGRITIDSLKITDRNGNAAEWVSDKTNMQIAPDVALPFLEIRSGVTYEVIAPIISRASFTEASISKGSPLRLTFGIEESSGISSVNLFLINTTTRKIKLISAAAESVSKSNAGEITVDFDISTLPESGIYRIQSVSLYDIFGNKTTLKSSSVIQEMFDSTTILVPSFEYLNM